jgi:hypothetical protein
VLPCRLLVTVWLMGQSSRHNAHRIKKQPLIWRAACCAHCDCLLPQPSPYRVRVCSDAALRAKAAEAAGVETAPGGAAALLLQQSCVQGVRSCSIR